MPTEKLTKAGVAAIEAKIDGYFDFISLPTPDLNTARWIVCLVNEDQTRFALCDRCGALIHGDVGTVRDGAPARRTEGAGDREKGHGGA
jgi:hypothetical protein